MRADLGILVMIIGPVASAFGGAWVAKKYFNWNISLPSALDDTPLSGGLPIGMMLGATGGIVLYYAVLSVMTMAIPGDFK